MGSGAPYGSLTATSKKPKVAFELGAGLRLFYGTEVVYAYTNDLSETALVELAQTLAGLKTAAGKVNTTGQGGLDFRHQKSGGLHAPTTPLSAQPKRYRLERLFEADAGARIAPEIRQVEATMLEWEQDVLVANSEATWVEDNRVRSRLIVRAIAQNESEMQTGYRRARTVRGVSCSTLRSERRGPPRRRNALTNLRGKRAPAGTMPVVIGNAFGGVIFHEALGHLLETTFVAKGASALADMLGDKIASPCVTYVDDGTTPHGWGSSEYDDEGAPTERTVLIEGGVLKSYMVDRLGSLKTGYRPTGSGRRQDYTYAPTSRMRNTFITPGDDAKRGPLPRHRVRPLRQDDGRRRG